MNEKTLLGIDCNGTEIYGQLGLQEDVMIKVLAEVWIHSNAEIGEPMGWLTTGST